MINKLLHRKHHAPDGRNMNPTYQSGQQRRRLGGTGRRERAFHGRGDPQASSPGSLHGNPMLAIAVENQRPKVSVFTADKQIQIKVLKADL